MRALAAGILGGFIVVLAVPLPADASYVDGLQYAADVTYELEPSADRVRVTGDVTVTNQLPNEGPRYYYFDEVPVHAPAEAVDFSASTSGGGVLSTRLAEEDEDWAVWMIRLPSNLLYQQTQRVRFSYDLPDLPPRSEGWTRANAAAASFAAYVIGDPGLSSVTIVIPDEYSDVEVGGSELERSLSGGFTHYTAEAIGDPDTWWVSVAARNDDLLDERALTVEGHEFRVQYWPGDEEWADFAEEVLTAGVPVLIELIGRPWPVAGELRVIESSIPHAFGYAGWFDSFSNVIEVGDELDRETMLHELAHAWFNQGLTSERWFLEGLAQLYANLALEALDEEWYVPDKPSSTDPGAQPLTEWEQSPFDGEDEYAYGMAWWLVKRLHLELSDERMPMVLAAIADREISYRSDLEVETITGRLTWQRLLDLLVEVGESILAEDLFEEYVLGEDDVDLLGDREQARTAYAALLEDAGDWTAPLELRWEMTLWEFDQVDRLIPAAREVLESRDYVLGALTPLGIDELPALADAYHGAESIPDAIAVAELYVDVADELIAAQEPVPGVRRILAQVGLFGADIDGRAAGAAAALAAGEVEAASELAAGVAGEVDGAPLIGAVVAGQVALAAALYWPLRRLTVRRRERSAHLHTVGSDPWPTDEPFSSPSVR